MPSITLILTAVEMIHRSLRKDKPNYAVIEQKVMYLYEMLSDVQGLMELDQSSSEGDCCPLTEVRLAVLRTGQRLGE